MPGHDTQAGADGPGSLDARDVLHKLVRVLTWIEAAILTGYGLILTASGLLAQVGVIKALPMRTA